MTSSDSATDPDIQQAHVAIAAAAARQGATESRLVNSVSRHIFAATVSFANLGAVHAVVKDMNEKIKSLDFVASSGSELVFSSKFNFAPTPPEITSVSRKRRRDVQEDQADAVFAARKRLEKMAISISSEDLDTAQDVLVRLVTELRGPSNEKLVESYAILLKKLHTSDDRPRVVLALRLNAGIPIPISLFKSCLGKCWKDGILTTDETIDGVCARELPLTDEALASREHGNAPLLVVTSI